jgi:hypothetical protein
MPEEAEVWQLPDTQYPLWQSLSLTQVCPSAHAPHAPPPQSCAVSLPFLTPSEQVGAWHVAGVPEHTRLWQSALLAHVPPGRHAGQAPPHGSVAQPAAPHRPLMHVAL